MAETMTGVGGIEPPIAGIKDQGHAILALALNLAAGKDGGGRKPSGTGWRRLVGGGLDGSGLERIFTLQPVGEFRARLDGKKPLPTADTIVFRDPFAPLGVEDLVGSGWIAPERTAENLRRFLGDLERGATFRRNVPGGGFGGFAASDQSANKWKGGREQASKHGLCGFLSCRSASKSGGRVSRL